MTELTTPQHIKVNSSSPSHNEELDELRQQTQNMPQSQKPKQKCSLDFIWKDINIKLNKKKVKDQKALLTNLSGRVKGGECLAILGSSGAGKTTLLNFLSRKIETSTLISTGSITLNGKEVNDDEFSKLSAYVMQDDILESCMTPSEILLFTAKLKLGLSDQECEKKVVELISELHLERAIDTRVGDNITRGVSGGERKRTSIGVELISNPSIIFLDEPTTGLDSFNAYELIKLLNSLARNKHKVIIFTIHQPSSEIFDLLDKVCILALGKTIFFGQKDNAWDCFERMKQPIPPRYNPFDFFIEVTNVVAIEKPKTFELYPGLEEIPDKQERFKQYIDKMNQIYEENKDRYWDNSELVTEYSDEIKKSFLKKRYATSTCKQFRMLFLRKTVINRRKMVNIVLKICQAFICGLFVAALYCRITKNSTGIMDRQGVLCCGGIVAALTNLLTNLLSFSEEKAVFLRERSNNLYSVVAYFFSKICVEFPSTLILIIIYHLLTFYTVELNDTKPSKFWQVFGILILTAQLGSGYAHFFGSLFTEKEPLMAFAVGVTIPLMLLSGFFAAADNFAPYLIPFKYLSSYKYSYQAFTHIEYTDMSPLNCFNVAPDICNPIATRFTFDEPFYASIVGMVCLLVALRICAFLGTYFLAKIKV